MISLCCCFGISDFESFVKKIFFSVVRFVKETLINVPSESFLGKFEWQIAGHSGFDELSNYTLFFPDWWVPDKTHLLIKSHTNFGETSNVYDNHIWSVLLLSSGGGKAIKVIESIKLSSEGLRGLILTFSQSTFSTVGTLTLRNSGGCLLWLFLWCFWTSASKSLRDLCLL